MSGNIDDVIDAPHDPEVTVFVAARAVAGEVDIRNFAEVLLLVALGIAVNGAHHRRPGPFDHEKAALVGSDGFPFPIDDIDVESRQRPRGRARLCRHSAGNRSDHHGTGFGLPPGIDYRTTV